MTTELPQRPLPEGAAVHVSPEERHRMIAVAAYFLAERRGFAPGREQDDWWQAAEMIDGMLDRLRGAVAPQGDRNGAALRNALRQWVEQPRT